MDRERNGLHGKFRVPSYPAGSNHAGAMQYPPCLPCAWRAAVSVPTFGGAFKCLCYVNVVDDVGLDTVSAALNLGHELGHLVTVEGWGWTGMGIS